MPYSIKAYNGSWVEETLSQSVPDLPPANRSTPKKNLTTKSKRCFLFPAFINKTDTIEFTDLGPAQGQTAKTVIKHPYRLGKPLFQYCVPGNQAVQRCEAMASSAGCWECYQAWEKQEQLAFHTEAIKTRHRALTPCAGSWQGMALSQRTAGTRASVFFSV